MWGLLLLLCILGCTAVCDPAKVRQMELELSRFTDPLFDVRQTDAVLPARSVLEHIRVSEMLCKWRHNMCLCRV